MKSGADQKVPPGLWGLDLVAILVPANHSALAGPNVHLGYKSGWVFLRVADA